MKNKSNLTIIIALIFTLASASLTYTIPTAYPVSITRVNVDPPTRGKDIKYLITIQAFRTVNIQVDIDTYIPGIGWSGWKTLWTGKLYRDNTKTVNSSYYISEDAATGTIILWINVKYYSPKDHDIINGKTYYGDYSIVVAAGTIADPYEKYWYTMYKKLKQNYTDLLNSYDTLKEKYIVLQTLYNQLEANYNRLNQTYNSLKTSHQTLEQDYKTFKDKYDQLKTENTNLKTHINILTILLAIITITTTYIAIKQYQQKQECINALKRAHTYKQTKQQPLNQPPTPSTTDTPPNQSNP